MGIKATMLKKDKVRFWQTKVEGIRNSEEYINTLGHIPPKTVL